ALLTHKLSVFYASTLFAAGGLDKVWHSINYGTGFEILPDVPRQARVYNNQNAYKNYLID
ncbi:hypothetical protein, partial [Photobacterium sp. BZF1]|uniref:hypothetical protein n=1 Tax=Photobacterium sp. BZF1 TaxID=1904457 RepID=UPI001CA3EBD2